MSDFGDDERLGTLRQKAEGFKTFSYPGVGFVTSFLRSPTAFL
ncbi:MAG: hypothetical protein ACYTXA_14050 [Nostoc sp.]